MQDTEISPWGAIFRDFAIVDLNHSALQGILWWDLAFDTEPSMYPHLTRLRFLKEVFLLLVIGSLLAACGGNESTQPAPGSAKAITAFSLNGTTGVISGANIAVTVPYGTAVNSLVASFTTSGKSVAVNGVAQTSGNTANDFTGPVTYVVTAADGSTASYTVTVTVAPKSAKAITAFSLNGTAGVISGANIAVTVPYGTAVNSLVASFTTSGKSVAVNGVAQTSGNTANDFTGPVTYVVTAADGSTASYTVTVTVAPKSAKAITAFSLNGTAGVISGPNIAVTVPYGTAVNSLVASFTTSGESVAVNGVAQASGTTANDFTSPVTYVVTAADGTAGSYTVTVTVAPSSAKAIMAFSLYGTAGVISGQNIAVTVPYGTTVNSLVASFTTSGESVAVNGVAQTSGNTANDFTGPVTYVVTAADGSTASYTVTVTVAPSSAKAITAFSLKSIEPTPVCTTSPDGIITSCIVSAFAPPLSPVAGVITGNTITVTLPILGRYPAMLAATFSTTGESVSVGNVIQISGQTENGFFGGPVSYLVKASDGSVATYIVNVVASDPLCSFTVLPGESATSTVCS
ncbi:hypothetical protein [Burkholderia ubonensis]|uniref:hypothetical protein n=1 Tax=Burkholderia ubonensis TaxID=101571 RepID=UPI0012FCE4DE|nr:hypothetical protein [Burkholderia ubonensis]